MWLPFEQIMEARCPGSVLPRMMWLFRRPTFIAANGRIRDVDIATESTNLAKYQVLVQASASMLAQANSNTDVALMLLR